MSLINENKLEIANKNFKVCFRNETSHTVFNNFTDYQLIKLELDGFFIKVPTNICQKGHMLTCFFFENQMKAMAIPLSGRIENDKEVMDMIGKVMSEEKVESNHEEKIINIRFTQYNKANWEKILRRIEEIQNKLNMSFQIN